MSPTTKSLVDAEAVNVNAMVDLLVVEPLVTPAVVDVIVMVGGGRTNVTLPFPKNALSVVEGEITPNLPLFIVTTRSTEVPWKELEPIEVTELGMFMDVKLLEYWKALAPIVWPEVPTVTDVKFQQLWKA